MTETTETTPLEILRGHDALALRPNGWTAKLERDAEEAAKERSTCSTCLGRTYRQEECVCEDGGDAEDYDEALQDEISKGVVESVRVAVGLYDPHGNHVETVESTISGATLKVVAFIENMALEGLPCSIIIEPEGAGE